MAKKGGAKGKEQGPPTITNRRAYYDYNILDTYEAGIVLVGSEVKSIWKGRANLTDAFCRIRNNELWVINLDIEPYEHSAHFLPERRRDRKLLVHKHEIRTLNRKIQEKGLTLIPLKMYFHQRGKVKVLIGLGQGKKQYDKRVQIAEKETRREKERMRSEKF